MVARFLLIVSLLAGFPGVAARGADADLPPGQKVPLLRIDGKGPTASVTGLAFSPDGNTLYAGGYDKEVRVWTYNEGAKAFQLDRAGYRVLIGPGHPGIINAIALSPDGGRLAIGGVGVFRGGLGFEGEGVAFPPSALSEQMRQDQGVIYVYTTGPHGNRPPAVRLLRGHRGPVLALAFVPAKGKQLLLVSVAREPDEKNQYRGVAKVWDVRTAKCLATLSQGLPRQNKKPALAVWPTGAGPKQLRVALAWDDGHIRLWDVDRGNAGLRNFTTGKFSKAALYLPGSNPPALLSTSFQTRDGIIQEWKVPADFEEAPRPAGRKVLPPTRNEDSGPLTYSLPVALAPLASGADGKLDLLAVLVQTATQGEKDRLWLRLIKLGGEDGTFGPVAADVPLWAVAPGDDAPVLATAPRGRFLAVAGSRRHVIRLFAVANLLRGRNPAWQLESEGANLAVESFLSRGKDLALKLRETGGKRTLVFDFSRAKLGADLKGWEAFAPDTEDWKVQRRLLKDEDGRTLVEWSIFRQGERAGPPILIDPAVQQVTCWKVLPTMKPWNVPLLALAYLDADSGEAVLCLYDVKAGRRVRQFEGHVGPVRSLAFSADGRLLASASEDQTICLWSLTQLPEILHKHGMVPGLVLGREDGGLVVQEVTRDSPAHGKLTPGDRIDGIVLGGNKLQRLAEPREFYEAVWEMRPDDVLTLRVRGKGPVQLRVVQGVDERNALLSLFITRARQGGKRDWIGWNPLGFYDASGPAAEDYLLWHFNKGAPDEPTATAPAGQFRKEHQKKGLLKFLAARGDPSRALEDWKRAQARLKRPLMLLWVAEVGPDPQKRDGKGRVPVTQRQTTLVLQVGGFPLEEGDSLTWEFNGGAPQEFQKQPDGTWAADLARAPWKRGLNRVRAVLHVGGDGPQRFAEDIDLNFRPPAPAVVYPGSNRRVVHAAKFILQADVVPAPGEKAVVTLSQKFEGKELLPEKERTSGPEVRQPLTLRRGLNRIEIVARNGDATAETAEAETTREILEVYFSQPMKDDPPQMALIVEDPAGGTRTKVKPGARVVVAGPRVRLTGTIEAKKPLAAAKWTLDGKDHSLAKFVPNKNGKFPINEDIRLDVKPHKVVFLARTENSDPARLEVELAYHPQLPKLTLTSPPDDLVVYAGEGKPEVTVGGDLAWPDDVHPCTAEILVNGAAVRRVELDRAARALAVPVRLTPGDNQVQVRLTNAWGREATTERAVVRYLRRPLIAFKDTNPKKTTRAILSLVARVTSPVKVISARAEVRGARGRRIVRTAIKPPAGDDPPDRWTVELLDVVLDPGDNQVSLWVSNAEASCKAPATLTVNYTLVPQRPRPPEVEVVYPAQGAKVNQAEILFRARIRSAVPLQEVAVIREGQPPLRVRADVARLARNPQGFFEVVIKVPLKPRENLLRLEAVNAGGGVQSDPVVVNYMPEVPVRLVIKNLTVRGGGGPLVPVEKPDGSLVFGQVPEGRVTLVGEVVWDPAADALMSKDYQLDVRVNGLRQLPVDLGRAEGETRRRPFKAEVSLTRAKGNRIKVTLPRELKQSAENQPVCLVDCAKPADRQRVYLLVIGVGVKDEQALVGKVFKALQATDVDMERRRFRTPTYFEGRLYGPVTGYVTARKVVPQLNRIINDMRSQKRADLRRPGGAPADVLLVYFQGHDGVQDGTYALRMSGSQPVLTRGQLQEAFEHTLGAQVLFLDVVRDGGSLKGQDRERWPEDSPVSVLRLAWLDPAEAQKHPFLLAQTLIDTLPRASSLKDLAVEVKEDLARRARLQDKLLFDPHIPPELASLPLGGRK